MKEKMEKGKQPEPRKSLHVKACGTNTYETEKMWKSFIIIEALFFLMYRDAINESHRLNADAFVDETNDGIDEKQNK